MSSGVKTIYIHYLNIIGHLGPKKIGAEVFGELRSVVLEENGEDKMV